MKLLLLHAIIFISNMKSIVIHDNGGHHVRTVGSKILCQLHAAAGPTTSTYYKVFGNGNSASLTLYSALSLPLPPSLQAHWRHRESYVPLGKMPLTYSQPRRTRRTHFCWRQRRCEEISPTNPAGYGEGDRLAD